MGQTDRVRLLLRPFRLSLLEAPTGASQPLKQMGLCLNTAARSTLAINAFSPSMVWSVWPSEHAAVNPADLVWRLKCALSNEEFDDLEVGVNKGSHIKPRCLNSK